tara:strand:+ start:61 stop:486 length:426 start_codon:yes stop_codon:yes gene_type:complete
MPDTNYIRVGFFEEFKGEDTVLISVDIYGLLELQSAFHELSKWEKPFSLSDLRNIDKRHELPINLVSSEKDMGLRKSKDTYQWDLTPNKWNEFSEEAAVLYKNGTIGHQYLDSNAIDNLDLQVILSLNEYDILFWNNLNKK